MLTPLRDLVSPDRHVALIGVTASGKSALALAAARHRGDVELISVDSMQVYRGMDIGTAKPSMAERAEIPHHMIDLVEASEEYTMARFAAELRDALGDIDRRGKRAILVGGTGLYLRAAIDDLDVPGQFDAVRAELEVDPDTQGLHRRLSQLDPVAAQRMEPTNRRRIVRALEVTLGSGRPFSSFGPGLAEYGTSPIRIIGIRRPRPSIDRRIEARYRTQMSDGFLEEVKMLDDRGIPLSRTAGHALGYRELLAHIHGEMPLADALAAAVLRTRQFARKQERWFRRDPRILWLDGEDVEGDATTAESSVHDLFGALLEAAGW